MVKIQKPLFSWQESSDWSQEPLFQDVTEQVSGGSIIASLRHIAGGLRSAYTGIMDTQEIQHMLQDIGAYIQEGTMENLIENISALPVAEQLNILDTFPSLYAGSFTSLGSDEGYNHSSNNILRILSALEQHDIPVVVRIQCKLIHQRIRQEMSKLSFSRVFPADQSIERVPNSTAFPDAEPDQIRMIAKDAIGIFHTNGLLQKIVRLPSEAGEEQPVPVSAYALWQKIENLGSTKDSAVFLGHSMTIAGEMGINTIELSALFTQVFPQLSSGEWQQWIEAAQAISDTKSRYTKKENEMRNQVDREITENSRPVFQQMLQEINTEVAAGWPSIVDRKEWQTELNQFHQEFTRYVEDEHYEEALILLARTSVLLDEHAEAHNLLSACITTYAQSNIHAISTSILHEGAGRREKLLQECSSEIDEYTRNCDLVNQKIQKLDVASSEGEIINILKENLRQESGMHSSKSLPVQDVLLEKELVPFDLPAQEHTEELLSIVLSPHFRDEFLQESGVDMYQLPLQVLLHLLRFLLDKDVATFARLTAVLHEHPKNAQNILTSFFACAEDPKFGDIILAMSQWPESEDIFQRYAKSADMAQKTAYDLYKQSQLLDPPLKISEQDFYRAAIQRANLLLREADACFWRDQDASRAHWEIKDVLKAFDKENALQSAARSFFLSQTTLLEKKKSVMVKDCAEMQRFIANTCDNAGAKSVLLQALQTRGQLAPVPEIHWRVDRSAEEYQRRLGIDLVACLHKWSDPSKHQTLLEFGPGNGSFSEERSKDSVITKNYLSFGMCDKVYYPLAPLIEKLINWDQIKQDTGAPLGENERQVFADFLYKILVLKTGTTADSHLTYDSFVQQELQTDATYLLHHLEKKGVSLATVTQVPSVISGRDGNGNVYYPNAIDRPAGGAFDAACSAFGQNPGKYLQKDADVYDLIPAYSPDVILGDFGNVSHLQDSQIDIACGVRATVYKRGAEYVQFMIDMSKKLTEKGFYIDDNVRDNDGWTYRIAELLEAKKHMDPAMHLKIVIGPAFEKEDYQQTSDGVPLAVILTRDDAKIADVEEQLKQKPADERTGAAYRLVDLEDLSQNVEYLHRLDATGRTASTVQHSVAI